LEKEFESIFGFRHSGRRGKYDGNKDTIPTTQELNTAEKDAPKTDR